MTIPPMNEACFLQLLLIGALWGASFPILRVITPELGAVKAPAGYLALLNPLAVVFAVL